MVSNVARTFERSIFNEIHTIHTLKRRKEPNGTLFASYKSGIYVAAGVIIDIHTQNDNITACAEG